ncbi:unnamed protein product, partial [Closterium sp. NIES-54]
MENWSGKKPLVDMLRVFGCMGLVHVPKERRDKLQAAAVWTVHLGLARGSKGWLMWDPKSNTIFTTRDAKFMEGLMFKEWSERGRNKVTIPLGIEVGTNDPLLIPIEFSSSSELTEVSHDLGGAEGEAADVEEVLQQRKAPVAKRGDTEEEVQQPTPSPKLPPRHTTQGKRDAALELPLLQPACRPSLLPALFPTLPDAACPACCAAMASLRVLAFDHEGRPIQFDTWLDDMQLYLLSDSRDIVSLFGHTYGAAPALPPQLTMRLAHCNLLHLLAAKTSVVAVGAARGTPRTPSMADSTASDTIVTRADICGAITTSSLMDGLLLKAKRVEEQEEGEEEAVEAVAVAEVVLQQLVKKGMFAGIRVKGEPDEVLGCPTCMQAKFTRYPFSSSEATAKAPLDEVVMDMAGPLKLGAAGAEYFLTLVDVYTRMTWVYLLSKKSDVVETVKTDWLPMVERQQDRL